MSSHNVFREREENPSYGEYNITVAEGTDEGLKERFICYCIEHSIAPEHAQAMIDFLQEEEEGILDSACEHSQKTLQERWGSRYSSHMNKAKRALLALDRKMEGRLLPLFEQGYGNHPLLIEMLYVIGSAWEEDSIAMPTKGFASDKAMSTEEFLSKVVFK